MKLVILSRYSRLGASSRLRTMQYLPYLSAAGIEVEVLPFFDDAYLQRLYRGAPARWRSAGYYLSRAAALLRMARPDVIWVEKEAFPWLPWWVEARFLPRGVPIVSDYDDAVFHRYDLHRSGPVRRVLGRKIDGVMAASALVTAGNPYLAERAARAGARRVEVVPTVVDMEAYAVARMPHSDGRPRVGWIGTPNTWETLAKPIFDVLRPELRSADAVFRAVGARMHRADGPEIEYLPWSEAEEAGLIAGMDIGVMPLPDTPWARGKCGYKLIQYMASGLPVVASPVGVNADIVEHGVTGFLAETEADWQMSLDRLLRDPALRRGMGQAGRKKAQERYALQRWGPVVANLMKLGV